MPDTDLTALANRIADLLIEDALGIDNQATWLAPALEAGEDGNEALQRSGDPTLYDGSAGIALACLAAGRALGRDDLLELAGNAAPHAVTQALRIDLPGLYDGRAGIGLAGLAVGRDLDDAGLAQSGLGLLEGLTGYEGEETDLISGLTGIAFAFLRGGELTGDPRWPKAAAGLAAQLVERAVREPWGWCWPLPGDAALCGLAHGAAGPAWILTEAAAASGRPDLFAEAVAGARQFERSWFYPRSNTWPDLRRESGNTAEGGPPRPALWCHDAVGIGVSRLAMDALTPHPALQAEVAAALQSSCAAAVTQVNGGALEHGLTLCHGLAGTLDFLIDAYLHFDEAAHLETAGWLADRALEILGDNPRAWPGGIQGQPSPGLMNGLAGAMVVLTSLAAPTAVPSSARLRLGTFSTPAAASRSAR